MTARQSSKKEKKPSMIFIGLPPKPRACHGLSQQFLHYYPFDISQPEFAPLEFVSQFGVINAHQMQRGRVQVVNADRIDRWVIADLVRFAHSYAGFDTSARGPQAEGSLS